jgi:galactose mutarotase-like enzyme
MARYLGGWSVLLPNAGPERVVDGALRGFHGEAALSPWRVEGSTVDSATFAVDLVTAPLSVTRTLVVDGPTVILKESVTNTSGMPTQVAWVHHPVFGLPFAGHPAHITAGARRLVTDAERPGDILPADTVLELPIIRLPDGRSVRHVGALPSPHESRSVFAALTDFDAGEFTIVNSDLRVGVRVEWDTAVFPYAWVWQECHASPGYPWFGKAFAVAIEPANVLPGFGTVGRPDAPVLDAHATWSTALRLTRFDA